MTMTLKQFINQEQAKHKRKRIGCVYKINQTRRKV